MVSSTNWSMLILICLLSIDIPSRSPLLLACLVISSSLSAAIGNKEGAHDSLCLSPFLEFKLFRRTNIK